MRQRPRVARSGACKCGLRGHRGAIACGITPTGDDTRSVILVPSDRVGQSPAEATLDARYDQEYGPGSFRHGGATRSRHGRADVAPRGGATGAALRGVGLHAGGVCRHQPIDGLPLPPPPRRRGRADRQRASERRSTLQPAARCPARAGSGKRGTDCACRRAADVDAARRHTRGGTARRLPGRAGSGRPGASREHAAFCPGASPRGGRRHRGCARLEAPARDALPRRLDRPHRHARRRPRGSSHRSLGRLPRRLGHRAAGLADLQAGARTRGPRSRKRPGAAPRLRRAGALRSRCPRLARRARRRSRTPRGRRRRRGARVSARPRSAPRTAARRQRDCRGPRRRPHRDHPLGPRLGRRRRSARTRPSCAAPWKRSWAARWRTTGGRASGRAGERLCHGRWDGGGVSGGGMGSMRSETTWRGRRAERNVRIFKWFQAISGFEPHPWQAELGRPRRSKIACSACRQGSARRRGWCLPGSTTR